MGEENKNEINETIRRMKMGNLILNCQNLHKTLGKKEILKDVSVELYEGDILGFIGPNGAR